MRKDHPVFKNRLSNVKYQAEAFPSVPIVEIAEDCRVLIENHLGILSYDNSSVSVKVRRGAYHVYGDKLAIACMTKCKIVITGNIDSVSYKKGEFVD